MQNTKMKEEMRPQDLSNRNQSFKIMTFHVNNLPYSKLGSSDFQVQRHIHITDNAIKEFLHVPPKSEEGEFIYELMVEQAVGFRSVETLLLHYFSEDYLKKTDYLFGNSNSKWALEFELITLVACQKRKLQKCGTYWIQYSLKKSKRLQKCQKVY